MTVIGRYIKGVVVNPMEYVLEGENGEILEFMDDSSAMEWLDANVSTPNTPLGWEKRGIYLLHEGDSHWPEEVGDE